MSQYEKLIKKNIIIIVSILLVTVISVIVLGIYFAATHNNDTGPLVVSIILCGGILLIPLYVVFIWKKMKRLKLKHYEYYKNILVHCDRVTTKMFISTGRTFKNKLWTIDKEGLYCNDIVINWADCDIKTIEQDIVGQKRISIQLFNRQHRLIIACNIKNFYLLKAFCEKEIPHVNEVEEWVKYNYRINRLENKHTEDLTDDKLETKVFKSHIVLIITVAYIVLIGLSVLIGILAAYLNIDSMIIIPFVVALVVMPSMRFYNTLPRGKTMINCQFITCKTIYNKMKIPFEKADVKVTKFRIVFSNPSFKISIYKTKKALEWVNACKKYNQEVV